MDGGTGNEELSRLRGQFWLSDEPALTVPGNLDVTTGTLDVESELVPSLVWTNVTPSEGSAIEREDSETLYLVHGSLDDGTKVTVARASRRPDLGIPPWRQHPQQFSFLSCSLGDHVNDEEVYDAVEIVPEDRWHRWLSGVDVSADVKITGVGEVKITMQDGCLSARGAPMTAEAWSRRMTDPWCEPPRFQWRLWCVPGFSESDNWS